MNKTEVYKKATENGYIIEYGKRHFCNKLYQRRDGTNVYPVVYDEDGEPEYGYDIIWYLPGRNDYVSVFNVEACNYTLPAEWEDVVDFVNDL